MPTVDELNPEALAAGRPMVEAMAAVGISIPETDRAPPLRAWVNKQGD